jgi:hypothetical protein
MVQARGATPQTVESCPAKTKFDRPRVDDCHHIAPCPPSARTRALDPSAHRMQALSRELPWKQHDFCATPPDRAEENCPGPVTTRTRETMRSPRRGHQQTRKNSSHLSQVLGKRESPVTPSSSTWTAPRHGSVTHVTPRLPIRQRRRPSLCTFPPIRRTTRRGLGVVSANAYISYEYKPHWYSLRYGLRCVPVRPDSCRTMNTPDAEH